MANNHGPRPPTSQFSRKPLRYHTGQLRVNYRYCLCLSDNRSIVSVTTPPRGLAPPYLPARVERGRSEHTYSSISARFRYFADIKIHAHVCSNFRPSIKYTIIHQRCVTKLQRQMLFIELSPFLLFRLFLPQHYISNRVLSIQQTRREKIFRLLLLLTRKYPKIEHSKVSDSVNIIRENTCFVK